MTRILLLNLLGTDMNNDYRVRILEPVLSPGTELVARNLQGVPETPFLPTPAVFYNQMFQAVIDAEREGFDGIMMSCCSDPGLKDAKTLVDIPVTAPFEAAARTAPALGRLSVIVPLIEAGDGEHLPGTGNWARDLAREYGISEHLASVRGAPAEHPSQEETMRLFAQDPHAVRALVLESMGRAIRGPALDQARRAVYEDEATVLFFGCSIWSGMLGPLAREVPAIVLDPLVTTLKYIEALATARTFYVNRRRHENRPSIVNEM